VTRLALVLGSGGVRSVAALGVVQRLQEEGIRPDLVVGCSSGALFGATIAMGLQTQHALGLATRLWSPELTRQRRWRAYAQMALPRLAGFDAGFALRDDALIARRVGEAFGDALLEQLPTPLRVAATDAATGRPVVLTRGRLADAVRASMAVPVIFPSVEFAGRRLVDGVLSDPLPIGAAEDADVILALGFSGRMPSRVDRLSRLVAQASTTLINNLMQARMAAAQAAGRPVVLLELALSRPVGLWEPGAMPELFEAGRLAAQAALPRLSAALARRATPVPRRRGHPAFALPPA
jgi:NTE family protein